VPLLLLVDAPDELLLDEELLLDDELLLVDAPDELLLDEELLLDDELLLEEELLDEELLLAPEDDEVLDEVLLPLDVGIGGLLLPPPHPTITNPAQAARAMLRAVETLRLKG
jgi:hypothetical protein